MFHSVRAADLTDEALRTSIRGLKASNIYATFDAIAQWVLVFGAIGAVIAVMIAGVLMVSSKGDATKLETGKKTLTWAIVGLALIVLARGITTVLARFVQ